MTVILPLPGIMTPSTVSSSPPNSVQASPVTTPTWSSALDLAVAVAGDAEILLEVLAA